MGALRDAGTEEALTMFPAETNLGVFEGFQVLASLCHSAFRAADFLGGLTTRALSGLQRFRSRFQLRQGLLRVVIIGHGVSIETCRDNRCKNSLSHQKF
jgi:hypothetical protein